MSFERGTYYYGNLGSELDWLYALLVEQGANGPRIKVKYIKETNGLTPFTRSHVFGERYLTHMKTTPEGRLIGKIILEGRKEDPKSAQICLRSLRKNTIAVRLMDGTFTAQKSYEAPPQKAKTNVRVGGMLLDTCCVESLEKMNTMVDSQYKLDFVALIGDGLGVLDSANGMAQALNSLIQKAATNNATSPSVMMGPSVRNKIQEIAVMEQNHHQGKKKQFWEAVEKAWGTYRE